MENWKRFIIFVCLLTSILVNARSVDAQQNLAQQAYAIFEQSCLNCHGPHGAFTEEIIIEYTYLIETGAVVQGKPDASELYKRLIEKRVEKRMPLGQPPLTPAAIDTIGQWILAGAPNWEDTSQTAGTFITPTKMLETIENHVNSLPQFDRTFARYFMMTHLYNAGETTEALHAYQRALSKLVNSLSWGREVIRPQPIDAEETIFYIDLRDYEWEIGNNRWTQIEQVYPYEIQFLAPAQKHLREKLITLREKMDCEVPFVHVDWFLANASLPPLYHDILDLPETDQELETRLEVNVVENIRNAAGKRVWRAGFSESGVSNHNRVVERHTSRYGAYWKSYDFAGSAGKQYIFTHPLSFEHDGGEIIFNLPNGLQAYYLADAGGRRLDDAPIDIVSNPAASDPTVRNGLSCIGCHTEGMKTFEDQVRDVVEKNPNPPFNKDRALRLYVEQETMDGLVDEDTDRYRQALEAAGGVFGGIEPVQRFHEAFWRPLDAPAAAASVGLETEAFLQKIRQNVGLKNLGLLVLENDTMKRDTRTEQFSEVIFALDFPEKSAGQPVDDQTERIPGEAVYIPDVNLRAVIEEALGKASGAPITAEEMATLINLRTTEAKGISDLTGIEFGINLRVLDIGGNSISDLSPLAGLMNLGTINISGNGISDLSPLVGLKSLENFLSWNNLFSDLSPLVKLTEMSLQKIDICGGDPDISVLKDAKNLKELYLPNCQVSDTDIAALAGLTNLTRLSVSDNRDLSNIAALSGLTNLKWVNLRDCNISDISALSGLTNLKWVNLARNNISDFSPLDGLPELTTIIDLLNPGSSLKAGPSIEGPWLWVIAPLDIGEGMNTGDIIASGIDLLSEMSDGEVTELKIATHGATKGAPVGDSVWKSHKISPTNNNINDMANATGLGEGSIDNHVAYGSIHVFSPRQQETHLFLGADTSGRVWLNGEFVGETAQWFTHIGGYGNVVPVTLKEGVNFLFVAIHEDKGFWRGLFAFEEGTEYSVSVDPRIEYTFSKSVIHAGDTFSLDLNIENTHNLAGWQFDVAFDPTMLEAVEVSEGDFLNPEGNATFFQGGSIDNATGKITKLSSARLSEEGVSGRGALLSVTFTAKTVGQTQLSLENFQLAAITGESIPARLQEVVITIEGQLTIGDVNRDGQVNIQDMVLVARRFGETVPANSAVDVNGDGVISILDLIIVAAHLGESTDAAAPSGLDLAGIHGLDSATIQAWIAQAALENDGSIAFQRGLANLQRLLASLIPEKTVLLANYPNPFNPETWIPYHLANPSDVQITIYDTGGSIIRRLELGHQHPGYYATKNRAAYWDGRNEVGERVANGVYFYQLQADQLSLLRKMVILK
ncbi:MAG: leucine-rich repeat domain-containing protein [Candidatus Poribacteria bacterium]|nr:leucine-rich repeat domain-containing protein [Candidatus Poribacteria bacterium]